MNVELTVQQTKAPASEVGTKLNCWLDAVGVLSLGWMLGLWYLGAVHAPPGREWLTLALAVATLPLFATVLGTFGRPPGRSRWVAAVPVLALLFAAMAWRFVVGFALALPDGRTYTASRAAGFWDSSALALGLAAAAVLVVRQQRVSGRVLAIAITAVLAAVGADALQAVVNFVQVPDIGERDWAIVTLGLLVPSLLLGLVGLAMAPAWLRWLRLGSPGAAAGLLVWGLVVWVDAVFPPYLWFSLHSGRELILGQYRGEIPVAGLNAIGGSLAVAAAVLLAPVLVSYRDADRLRRPAAVRGAIAMLALLLGAHLIGLLIEALILAGHPQVNPPAGAERRDLMLGLLGVLLLIPAAVHSRRRAALVSMLGGALLIAVPPVSFLLDFSAHHRHASTLLEPGMLIPPITLWGGYRLLITFVLPAVLLALLAWNARRRPAGAVEPEVTLIDGQDA